MTKAYSHGDEASAVRGVRSLPTLVGNAKPAEDKPGPETLLAQAKTIAEKITAKNWRQTKVELLAILNTAAQNE
jgi:hypothetical protein